MDIAPWVWWLTIAVTTAVLIFDVVVIGRRPHEPSLKECAIALIGYVGTALAFGIGVAALSGARYGTEFLAGWLTEYSLSIDNLFIFLIIMGRFAVPKQYQQTALMVGIVLALVMRGVFIAVGAAAIDRFSWIFYVFGAFLIYTAVTLVRDSDAARKEEHQKEEHQNEEHESEGESERHESEADGHDQDSRLVAFAARHLPATDRWESNRITAKVDGRRVVTPMFLVILTLGTTDLLFALDSIPAIYGLTEEPYLVLTANIFALMGLRQLYFLIGGLLERLVYLSYGLAFLLGFIGVKLVLRALRENELPFVNGGRGVGWAPDISIWLSLVVIVGTLAVTTVLSLWHSNRDAAADPAG